MAEQDTITEYSAEFWHQELDREAKRGGDKWRKRAHKVVQRYRDERDEKDETAKRFNILYSNVETLKPAISSRTPQPSVLRRFPDSDAVTRIAGDILGTTLKFLISDYPFDAEKDKARDDGLIAGLGVLWVDHKVVTRRRTPKLAQPALPPPQTAAPMPPALPPPSGNPAPMGPGLPVPAMGGAAPMAPPAAGGAPGTPIPPGGAMLPPALGAAASPGLPIGPEAMMPAALGAVAPPALPPPEPPKPTYELDGKPVEPDGVDEKTKEPYVEEIVEEWCRPKHILWRYFRRTPINDWGKVWWIAYAEPMSKHEIAKEFGEKWIKELTFSPFTVGESEKNKADDAAGLPKVPGSVFIWRIWCKWTRKVYVIAEGLRDRIIKESPVPFDVEGFFPVPTPYRPIGTTDKWEPIPEYCIYQDQAEEIDLYTARMNKITAAIQAKGAAPATVAKAFSDIQGQADTVVGNIEDFESLLDVNGKLPNDLGQMVAWLPIENFAKVLQILSERRNMTKQELYEITGISDLMRQATMASETATAQQLKGNFGNMRLLPRQVPFERFIRDTFRIMAEVIAEKFSRQTLEQMSGQKLGMTGDPTVDQVGEQVLKLLRDDKLRSYRIDVETDTMIAPDEQAEKQATVEFVTAITNFLQAATEIAGVSPQMVPLLMQMLKQASRRFKLGRELEETIEKTVEDLEKLAKNPPPPPPDPEVEKEKIRTEGAAKQTQMQAEADKAKAEHEARVRDEEGKRDHERKMREIDHRAQLERERMVADDLARQQEAARADKDAEHKRVIEAEKQRHEQSLKDREAAMREAEGRRKDEETMGKREESAAAREERDLKRQHAERENQRKDEAHAADMDLKKQEKESKGAQNAAITKLADAADNLAKVVDKIGKPRKVKKTGNGEYEVV